jgi:hypothetical protein
MSLNFGNCFCCSGLGLPSGRSNLGPSILLAGAMMGVAKMLYHNNLTEQEYDNIMNHNGRDLLNLLKPTIHYDS